MSPCCLTGKHAGKRVTLVNWGSPQLFVGLIQRFQFFSTIAKRDRLQHLKPSRSIAHIMKSGDTCPQGTFNAAVVATLRRHYPERFPRVTS